MIKNILISLFIGFILLMSTVPSFFITELCVEEEDIDPLPQVAIANEKEKEEVLNITKELQEYKDNGCNIISYSIDFDNLLAYKSKGKVFDVNLSCYELKIDDNIYYFKSIEESENFKNKINDIKEKEIEIAEIAPITEMNFTNEEELNQKVAAIQEEKEKEEAEARRIQEEQERQQRLLLASANISSRSGNDRSEEEPIYSDYAGGRSTACIVCLYKFTFWRKK